jgi:hypothetical protein
VKQEILTEDWLTLLGQLSVKKKTGASATPQSKDAIPGMQPGRFT